MGHVPQFPLQTKGLGETFPCARCPGASRCAAASPKTSPRLGLNVAAMLSAFLQRRKETTATKTRSGGPSEGAKTGGPSGSSTGEVPAVLPLPPRAPVPRRAAGRSPPGGPPLEVP